MIFCGASGHTTGADDPAGGSVTTVLVTADAEVDTEGAIVDGAIWTAEVGEGLTTVVGATSVVGVLVAVVVGGLCTRHVPDPGQTATAIAIIAMVASAAPAPTN